MAQYQEAKSRYNDARARQKEAEKSLKSFETESGPSLEAVNRKQDYARQVSRMQPRMKKLVDDAVRNTTTLANQVSAASERVKEFDVKIDGERKSFETKKKELAVSRQKLTQLQADRKNEPLPFDAREWNHRIVSPFLFRFDVLISDCCP